jgi:nitroreductase
VADERKLEDSVVAGAPGQLEQSVDEVLSTTRSVRKRLDFSRPVERQVIEECLRLAQQAPSGSNRQTWHFVVVTEPEQRRRLADVYREAWTYYQTLPTASSNMRYDDPVREAQRQRVAESAQYLADHMHEAPVLVLACIEGRPSELPVATQAGSFASILPAVWSFMLAARARGLGTTLTTIHLWREREAADVLGIPYEQIAQVALLPVAYTRGTDFKPARREPLERMLHWESWG